MGSQKRLLEEEEQKIDIAIGIAVEVGAVKACRFHDGFLFAGHINFTDAYKVAARNNKRGDYGDLFESQKELTDIIKEVAEDNSYESKCARCVELIERD